MARAVGLLGWRYIIGSAGKENALKATRSLVKVIKKGATVGVLVDGPLGPASQVKKGVVLLASWTQVPIVLISQGASRYWQFNSWDRFRIPKPFAKIKVGWLKPIHIPPDLKQEEVEQYRLN